MAGDGAYDIICPDYWWTLDIEGSFMNQLTLDYLDFDQPWWNKGWNDNVLISGKMYTSVGPLCLDLLRNAEVAYFNKDMIKNYNLNDPYNLVGNDNWHFYTQWQRLSVLM